MKKFSNPRDAERLQLNPRNGDDGVHAREVRMVRDAFAGRTTMFARELRDTVAAMSTDTVSGRAFRRGWRLHLVVPAPRAAPPANRRPRRPRPS